MKMTVLAVIFCLMIAATSHGQNQDADSQTLKAILAELRAIHQDIQVTETTQLLVAELQMQQGVVNRATESFDSAREKLDEVHRSEQQLEADLERTQDAINKTTNLDVKGALQEHGKQLMSNTDLLKKAERDSNANLQDMQQRLHAAQDKLASIETELSVAAARLGPLSK